MAAELDDLFASPEDCGLSRSILPSPCDRVAAKRGLFLGSVARNADLFTDGGSRAPGEPPDAVG
jgi:hypothetical protein